MAYDPINIGSIAGDGTGDDLRTGFTKINSMLYELMEDRGLVKAGTSGDVGSIYRRTSPLFSPSFGPLDGMAFGTQGTSTVFIYDSTTGATFRPLTLTDLISTTVAISTTSTTIKGTTTDPVFYGTTTVTYAVYGKNIVYSVYHTQAASTNGAGSGNFYIPKPEAITGTIIYSQCNFFSYGDTNVFGSWGGNTSYLTPITPNLYALTNEAGTSYGWVSSSLAPTLMDNNAAYVFMITGVATLE